MIILDTNVVSELMRPAVDRAVEKWLDAQVDETLFLTATSLSELLVGIELMPPSKRQESHRRILEAVLRRLFGSRVLDFDEAAARCYSDLTADARRRGRAIAILDGQIAAIAKSRGAEVATRHTSPFEAAAIGVINPWEYRQPE